MTDDKCRDKHCLSAKPGDGCGDKPRLSTAPKKERREKPCLPAAAAPDSPPAPGDSLAASHYVYLVRCCDGSLYCGYSTDPVRRAAVHNSGKGAKYTRSRLPVELVWTEAHPTKQAALSREWHLTRLTHAEKEALLRCPPAAAHSARHNKK